MTEAELTHEIVMVKSCLAMLRTRWPTRTKDCAEMELAEAALDRVLSHFFNRLDDSDARPDNHAAIALYKRFPTVDELDDFLVTYCEANDRQSDSVVTTLHACLKEVGVRHRRGPR